MALRPLVRSQIQLVNEENTQKMNTRSCLLTFLALGGGGVAGIAGIVVGIWAGVSSSNAVIGLISGIAVIAVVIFIVAKLSRVVQNYGRVKTNDWLSSLDHCKYKYAFDGTGIAIDGDARVIHLASRFDKELMSGKYPFGDVRKWESTISGKWDSIGNISASGAAGMFIRNATLEEETGLWITVRDVDHPKWFVKFGNNPAFGSSMGATSSKAKHELARWMEILNQTLNG